jgi:hypothetical protein
MRGRNVVRIRTEKAADKKRMKNIQSEDGQIDADPGLNASNQNVEKNGKMKRRGGLVEQESTWPKPTGS